MNQKHIIDLAISYWHKPLGLIFSCLASLAFSVVLLTSFGAERITTISSYVVVILANIFAWFYSNRLPRTKKNKVGFVVSIRCSNDDEYKKVKEDFVSTLRSLLKQGVLGRTFHFIDLPQHISDKIYDIDDAYVIKAKTKAHFIICGRVRLRHLDGKDYHVIEMEGAVGHKTLPVAVSNNLSREFTELFPRRIKIPTENDLLSFNFTSDWTECVAKYIIGIAAACSHDLAYAQLLFTDVQSKLHHLDKDFPVFKKIRGRLPYRFAEINIALARGYIELWRKEQDQGAFKKFVEHINQIPDSLEPIYEVLLLKGIEAFLKDRDINKSIDITKQCKAFDDPIWHFNLAFLLAYKGDLHKAIQQYRKGLKYDLNPHTISEIEDFIVWVVENEPEKYQLYYCLGFFNWKIKGDLKTATTDFEKFLERLPDDRFAKERTLTNQWLIEIEKEANRNF